MKHNIFGCPLVLIISCMLLIGAGSSWGQTPGLIIKPATGSGGQLLDPDGDGYVSQKNNGIQAGFTVPPDNDVIQSEIPYVALVRPDVQGDLIKGPDGGFTEIVGTDAGGNNAILTYSDENYLYYRFRLSGYASNSKSYSILIDTDQKFGFVGPNADDNAVTGNPGFEAEIVLQTNFNIVAYNVDGSATRPETPEVIAPYETNCQKSIALSMAGNDPDYFYDFYISYPTNLFNKNTLLRFVALTCMNPMPAIGNNATSDIGGVGEVDNLDDAFIDLINGQTPTTPGGEVLERTACPVINPVAISHSAITGTTEPGGATIRVYVYQNDGKTLIGSATTTTAGSAWTINVSALSPAVTLTSGYKIKATAIASGKGISYDNCSERTVANCTVKTVSSGFVIAAPNNDKGLQVTNQSGGTATITLYNADYTMFNLAGITNPQTNVANGTTAIFECNRGKCFPNGLYYYTFQKPGECVSDFIPTCFYSTANSNAPVITTTNITQNTISVSGTCKAVAAPGAIVQLYADGILLKSINVINSSNWTIEGLDLTSYACKTVTVTETDPGMCPVNSLTGVVVSRQAAKPVINLSGCSVISPLTTVSGFSTEADGTTITLYSSDTSVGTGLVSGGVWTVTGLNLVAGNTVVARVTAGSCLTPSLDSDAKTISTQTHISDYTLDINPSVEGQTSVSGSISGGSYPAVLNLFIDETPVGSGVVINSAGNWILNGLNSFDLAIGGKIQATITYTGITGVCESELSSVLATVQCVSPSIPVFGGGSNSYCLGGTGKITLSSSETGVIYQLVNASGTIQGPASVGTGSPITLYTNVLNVNLLDIYIKASRIGNNPCSVVSSQAIHFDSQHPSPTVSFTNTGLSVARGTTALAMPYSSKSIMPSADNYTIDYSLAANNQGFADVVSQTPIPAAAFNLTIPTTAATGTYSGTITIYAANGASCTTSYGFTVTVFIPGSAPVIGVHPSNKTICTGNTASLNVEVAGAVTSYQWQSASSYGGPYTTIAGAVSANYTTAPLATTTYYRVIASNTYGSVSSQIATVTVTSAVAAAGAIFGSNNVCAGQNGVAYGVGNIDHATSYNWSYSGTGAFISGTGSSVYINFGYLATSGILSVAGTNSCGSGTVSSYSITVNSQPTVEAGTAVTTCSDAGAINITSGAKATNYSGIVWTSNGSGIFSNATALLDATYQPSAADIAAGSVTLTLTALGKGGCPNATDAKTLSITAVPVATAGVDISTCSGSSSIAMTGATASGAFTGTPIWSGGDGTWVQHANPALATFTPSTSNGSFTATMTLAGCSSVTSSRTISWGTLPVPTFTSSPGADACVNEDITYSTQTGFVNYVWTVSGTPGTDYFITAGSVGTGSHTVTIKWLKAGSKTVTVKYSDSNGCTGSEATSNTVIHELPPVGTFN